MSLIEQYRKVRRLTENICNPLQTEDYVVQPIADVSPPKWHLGHTTWFFETMILKPYLKNYLEFDANYNYVFNSYYESLGARVIRTHRGNLSRPTVNEVYRYRVYVDEAMEQLLGGQVDETIHTLTVLGCNHEEQHQELLWTDIKYILGHNPLFPAYDKDLPDEKEEGRPGWINIDAGIYQIGYQGSGFCYDNELAPHQVYLQPYRISSSLVSNEEYLAFIEQGGYRQFEHWYAEGWDWVKNNAVAAPMYWYNIEGSWYHYTLQGLQPLAMQAPVTHISFYEAAAYAAWKGCRLPTEFEWEAAAPQLNWGRRWEWTESAYLPYPGFQRAAGAVGEYNGKFMVNQKVLRGASGFTPPGHSRPTYRNFFHPHLRWQLTGIRLAV